MAESLVLPVVRCVIGKAADALVQSVTRMWGIDSDRNKLERHLVYVSSMLDDAEVKSETNLAISMWMKALKAAAYKADDVLDDFQYEALRREAQASRSMASKVLSNFTSKNRLVFRYKASRDLKDVLHKIDELVTEMNHFGLVAHMKVPQVPYRQSHSALDESKEFYGRDDDKALLVKLLLDQRDQQNVQVLPVIGMGGLGKTTLVKMVFNDIRVKNHFELKMWHCVSENFEATAIVRSIIELATNNRCDLSDNIELLRAKLHEVIGRKKFLLVLDDVWNEDKDKWADDLRPLLCSSIGGSGSMMVVTSRSSKVASIMGTLPPHKPTCLSDRDAWDLFSKKAFSEGMHQQEELIAIGRRIVSKCKGLPLALKTMGGLMSSKQELQEWEAIANCNIGDTTRGKDEVMSILKLSYTHLSSEMKRCFAFCAVFPKDYEMEKDVLIQLWMANGYIHGDRTMSLEQKAEFIFNELVWRSFLQQELNVYKMHDLMHDLAKDVADECATGEELIHGKDGIFHLLICEHDELNKITPLSRGTINLRTLMLTPRSSDRELAEAKLMPSRALCFQSKNSSIVLRQLTHTTHLRYLDLSGSEIVSLPDSVCMLYNLLSLRLNYCSELRNLPEGMCSMRKLSHIYLLGCDRLERMPPKLSLLQNLRTLTMFIVDTEDGRGIEELEDLQQVGNRLELYNLRDVKYGSKVNLQEKQNLSELVLYWERNYNDDEFYMPTFDDAATQEQVLKSLVPHDNLNFLEVHEYSGRTISPWMRKPQMFRFLRELIMVDCIRCKDLPVVWLSPSLERLYLSGMRSLTTLCKNVDVEGKAYNTFLQIFPKLKSMKLHHLRKLKRWVENGAGEINGMVLFPQLEELTISYCNNLRTVPESPVLRDLRVSCCSNETAEPPNSMSMSLGLFSSLVHLYIERSLIDVVMRLDGQQNQRPLDTLQHLYLEGDDGFISIFNESKLRLSDRLGGNILRWPVEELGCLQRLQSLSIRFCNNLEGMGLSLEQKAILPLPLLKLLEIVGCKNLLEIPQLPTSLEEMKIWICRSLVALPSDLGNLCNLRLLTLVGCSRLKTLPSGMDGLTSLEWMEIIDCPGIQEFPQGLLQRLPSLKSLKIEDCPELARRCREGGEYFNLVSFIPEKYITSEVESETQEIERPVKRFLPWCGGGSRLRCVSSASSGSSGSIILYEICFSSSD